MKSPTLFFLVAVLAFGMTFSSRVAAQDSSTWGSTSISYDLDSDTVTGTATVEPDYLASDYYEAQVVGHLRDGNFNIIASGSGYGSVTLDYTGTTDGMEYLMEGNDYEIMTVQDSNPGPHYGYYEDYYDYYVYEFEGIDSPDYYDFEASGPLEERSLDLIHLGETYSETFARKPDHLLIYNDLVGRTNGCGGAVRELDFVVHSGDHHVISSATKYFEDLAATDSCFNEQVRTTSSCTSFSGAFSDTLNTGCGGGATPPADQTCGFDAINHWKWCHGSNPTLGTFTNSVHYTLVKVNGNTGTPTNLAGTDPAPK